MKLNHGSKREGKILGHLMVPILSIASATILYASIGRMEISDPISTTPILKTTEGPTKDDMQKDYLHNNYHINKETPYNPITGKELGTLSWRNNNPGNLKFIYKGCSKDDGTQRTYAEAVAKANSLYNNSVLVLDYRGLAIFKSSRDGEMALEELLMRKFATKNISEMLRIYANNGPTGHMAYVKAVMKCYPNPQIVGSTKLEDLTYVEFKTLIMAIEEHEGYKVGQYTTTTIDNYLPYIERFALVKYQHELTIPKEAKSDYVVNKSLPSSIGQELVKYARKCIGTKYVYGASRWPLKTDKRFNGGNFIPTKNMSHDCCSLIVRGVRPWVNIPWSTRTLRQYIRKHGSNGIFNIVLWKDRQPGDIYLFRHAHVGIVENKEWCIEAKGKKRGVIRIKANKIRTSKIEHVLRFKEA